jgi:mono/diheme cytochrome c family protein
MPREQTITTLLAWFVVAAVSALGNRAYAQAEIRVGREVYERSCATQYCHGAKGSAGGAPAIAGRGRTVESLSHIIREGVPNTAMPGWEDSLSVEEVEAVIAYAASLQHVQAAGEEQPLDPNRAWLSHPGRELFFDSNRITPCGSCHRFDGLGLAVAPSFKGRFAGGASSLRDLTSDLVVTVASPGEAAFIAIAASGKVDAPRWYDLTKELPVLRTFDADEVSVSKGSSWSHAGSLGSYSDEDLKVILDFLRQAMGE